MSAPCSALRALVPLLAVALLPPAAPPAGLRRASFDRDPGWEGRNHRSRAFPPREIRQDFGYSRTAHAGGAPGEIGGWITPAGEPAWYARRIPPRTLNDPLSASGTLLCASPRFHVLLGFFRASTAREWRTANSIALRLLGRGDRFYAYVEYATAKWRAGADSPGGFLTEPDPETGRPRPRGFALGVPHTWSLRYDPRGNGGAGSILVTLGGETAVCHLDPRHRADGARFDRFGLLDVLKHADDGGEIWLDDLTLLGERESFDRDPRWEGRRNRATYLSRDVRPRFDFGFSPTRFAGGRAAGELGGRVFRGDCREPERMACYGDRLRPLDLSRPLHAEGRVALRRGVSDSTVLLGYYHSVDSMEPNPSQADLLPRNFLGVAIEGPSREGFLFRPACRLGGRSTGASRFAPVEGAPPIYPDGASHRWSLDFEPLHGPPTLFTTPRGARLRASLDGRTATLDLPPGDLPPDARFDRFGIVTTWIDGNGQEIYFDDLRYTGRPAE